ncbi:hypothetical protein U1Q18_032688 [Sarracenia purpurea var. burkii]
MFFKVQRYQLAVFEATPHGQREFFWDAAGSMVLIAADLSWSLSFGFHLALSNHEPEAVKAGGQNKVVHVDAGSVSLNLNSGYERVISEKEKVAQAGERSQRHEKKIAQAVVSRYPRAPRKRISQITPLEPVVYPRDIEDKIQRSPSVGDPPISEGEEQVSDDLFPAGESVAVGKAELGLGHISSSLTSGDLIPLACSKVIENKRKSSAKLETNTNGIHSAVGTPSDSEEVVVRNEDNVDGESGVMMKLNQRKRDQNRRFKRMLLMELWENSKIRELPIQLLRIGSTRL